MVKPKLNNMYYFYINYPRFKDRTILIHHGDCGDCQNGTGKQGSGSNEKAFGPDHSQIFQMLKLPLNYWSKNLKIHLILKITHVANKLFQPPTTPPPKN